jgi:hypothetical protein
LRPDVYESGQTLNTSSYNLLFLADPTRRPAAASAAWAPSSMAA